MKYNYPYVKTFEYTKIIGIEKVRFGKYVIIDDFVLIYAKSEVDIGSYVHIASFCYLSATESIKIGNFCGLSSGVKVFTSSDDFIGTGFGNPTISENFRNIKSAPILIQDFAIIGANSVILPGVTIGEGASVSACSVVSSDLKPWGIYIQGKLIGFRKKDEVLANYKRFLELSEEERIGFIFKNKGFE